MTFKNIRHWLILAAIISIAAFLRLYSLDTIPPGLWPDEALNGTQALTEPPKLYYPENNGREGLIMWLDALSFHFIGVSMVSFRLVPAIIGILTVIGIYFLASELFKKNNIGLLAAFFTATSFWHINFSRINFRAIMLPLFLCWSFYFLFLGFRKKNWWPFVVSGILFGAGFYTYTSFRLAPIILFLTLFVWWLAGKKRGLAKKHLGQAAAMLIATFFCALPIGLYFLMGHIDQFFTRLGPISVFEQPDPLFAFMESLLRHLAMFNFYGDPNMRHNYSGDPQLFFPVGILFLVGFWQMAKKTFTGINRGAWEEILPHFTLFIWFFVMLLPGALTYEGLPHALRIIGVLPVCYILAAEGGDVVYNWLGRKMDKKSLAALAVLVLFISGFFPPYRYFNQWTNNPETRAAFTADLVSMGTFLKDTSADSNKYVIVYGGEMPVQSVKLIALQNPANQNINYIQSSDIAKTDIKTPAVVLFMANNQADLDLLTANYPNGVHSSDSESGAWTYYIKQKHYE